MYDLLNIDSMQINFVNTQRTKTYYTLKLYQLKKPINDIYIFFKKKSFKYVYFYDDTIFVYKFDVKNIYFYTNLFLRMIYKFEDAQ